MSYKPILKIALRLQVSVPGKDIEGPVRGWEVPKRVDIWPTEQSVVGKVV